MQANRPGRFLAQAIDRGVAETGREQKLFTFTAAFKLTHEMVDGEWVDIAAEQQEITGYFYLEKKDGTLNTFQIDKLRAAYGWDGRDLFWLQNEDLSSVLVQLTIDWETWNNATKLKVKFIDAQDAAVGVSKSDADAQKAIASRMGAKFRAHFGGSPVKAPPPAGKPTPVAPQTPQTTAAPPASAAATPAAPAKPPARPSIPKPAAAAPAAPPAPATMTAEEAWAAWHERAPKNAPQDKIESEWFRIMAAMFGKDVEPTPEQYARLVSEGVAQFVPF